MDSSDSGDYENKYYLRGLVYRLSLVCSFLRLKIVINIFEKSVDIMIGKCYTIIVQGK